MFTLQAFAFCLIICTSFGIQQDPTEPPTIKTYCGTGGAKLCGDKLVIGFQHMRSKDKAKQDIVGEDQYSKFREASRVLTLSDVPSYSGFLNVNKQYNSNIFFWFIPSQNDADKAPLILWLNGGPGTSSLFGLFVEHGPFSVSQNGSLSHREYSWTRTHSMIYIDNPVGTGFSYTENAKGYSKTQEHISTDLYKAMSLFYKIFPEFASRDFFIAGESYAGKYIPPLAVKIHIENQKKRKSNEIPIRLRGIMIGSGYFDPYTQNEYGDFLFNLGLLDVAQKATFLQEEAKVKELIEAEEWEDATAAAEKLIVGDGNGPSLFQNMTGFSDYFNLLQSSRSEEFGRYLPYLNTPAVRRAIHVGDQEFTRSSEMLEALVEDISASVKSSVELCLRLNYRVLFYSSQLDLVVPHTGIQKFISTLDWPGDEIYEKTSKRIWKVNKTLVGYTKFARNLGFVLLRNAGHIAAVDQPIVMYEMVNRFTNGKPF